MSQPTEAERLELLRASTAAMEASYLLGNGNLLDATDRLNEALAKVHKLREAGHEFIERRRP